MNRKSGKSLDADVVRALQRQESHDREGEAAIVGRVQQRVMKSVRGSSPFIAIRDMNSGWETLADGVERKVLHRTETHCSYLVRFAPGASFGGHAHAEDEECIVLSGALRIGGVLLAAGNYHLAGRGTAHGESFSESGALMFVRGPL